MFRSKIKRRSRKKKNQSSCEKQASGKNHYWQQCWEELRVGSPLWEASQSLLGISFISSVKNNSMSGFKNSTDFFTKHHRRSFNFFFKEQVFFLMGDGNCWGVKRLYYDEGASTSAFILFIGTSFKIYKIK